MAWEPQPQTAASASLPVPVGGINAAVPLAAMNPTDAVFMFNVHSSPMGVRVRDGWQEHVKPGTGIGAVRTIIPYHGNKSDNSDTKLFVATPNGIYDVTSSGTSATSKISFATQTGRAGWGTFANFQTAAGSFVAFCDEVNGYYLYTASTDIWARVAQGSGGGQINGANPNNFAQVLNWKNRLWFVEKDTAQAWYLPVNQLTGTVASFGFGSKFPQGGALAALANWTVDGGAGVDDQLVAVSNAGDVAIYQGTDPSDVTKFALKGYWNVGKVPPGRRFILDVGGDMLILSSRGLTSLVKLLSGAQSAAQPDFFLSYKVGNLIGEDMAARITNDGWSLGLHTRRNMLLVTVPQTGSEAPRQYAMYPPQGAWAVYRGLPMLCMGEWGGSLYFGTADGRVCIHKGSVDEATLTGTFTDITFSGMSAYTDLGVPGRLKRIGVIRPMMVSDSASPAVDVQARWDYDMAEIGTAPASGGSATSAWDSGTWDNALWGGTSSVTGTFRGATGFGHRAAIAFRGSSSADTTLVGFDITLDAGGLL